MGRHNIQLRVPRSPSPFPNEPAGATTLNRWAFDWTNVVAKNPPETQAQPWEGIYFQGAWGGSPTDEAQVDPARADVVTDQNGPVNPTTVGRYRYNSGNSPPPFGDALLKPSSLSAMVFPAGYTQAYASFYVKFSSNWFLPAAQLKFGNVWYDDGGFASPVIFEMNPTGTARTGYEAVEFTEPPYYLELRIFDTNSGAGRLFDIKIGQQGAFDLVGSQTSTIVSADSTARMVNGTWYHIEYWWNTSTRHVKMWIDGDLVAHGIAGNWPVGNVTEFSWDGTLGGQCTGGCPALPAEMYWYQDDLYLSYV